MYPKVIGEFATVDKICEGYSIARFGDGELKVLDGFGYTRTRYIAKPKLTAELRRVITEPHPKCLIGIPTMDPNGIKFQSFFRHQARFEKFVRSDDGNTYYSSLITRPDTGFWLETRGYYEHVSKIWKDQARVCVVSEPASKLLSHLRAVKLGEGKTVVHVECPMYDAYDVIDLLEQEVVAAQPQLTLISMGVPAAVLAWRLARRGLHAVDLGSIGGFLCRWRDGESKPTNREEYASERANGPDGK